MTSWSDISFSGRRSYQERASNVRGKALPGGHWLPEELPNEVYTELVSFLSSGPQR
jgi:hypothetical protein